MVPGLRIELNCAGLWDQSLRRAELPGIAVGTGLEPHSATFTSGPGPRVERPLQINRNVKELVGDLGLEPRFSCSQSKRVKPFPKSPEKQKGRPFLVAAPLLEIGMLFQVG